MTAIFHNVIGREVDDLVVKAKDLKTIFDS